MDTEDSTFALGLTAKQRADREGVVLPYVDAQKGHGGEGGRIFYDMGPEDDFDEEEDEI
jgi:elongator complex protein 5